MKMRQIKTTKIVAVLGVTCLLLGYQNCSKTKFALDDAVKEQTLTNSNVFDPNEVSGVDPTTPVVTTTPAPTPKATPVAGPVATPVASPTPKQQVGGIDPTKNNVIPKDLPGFDPSMLTNLIVTDGEGEKCNAAGDVCVSDPLLLQLNEKSPQPISLTAPEDGVMFDLLGRKASHQQVRASWFANTDGDNYFLVLPDKNGEVKGIDELFGDNTFGPDLRYAKQGFAALAKYDESNDHMISADDVVFSQLRLWKDENLDGIVQASELSTLDEKGVVAIDLRYDKRFKEVDKHGNVVKYKSVVIMKDNSYGLVYDLFLRYVSK